VCTRQLQKQLQKARSLTCVYAWYVMRGQAGRQAEQVRVYGGESVLRPGDVRQFVYQLVPRADSLPAAHKSWFDLGRLEMAWMVFLSLLM